ncbi:MAG: sigma-70 family RNA polymerase sigma factor [Candidatus Doudnabacteria bacterium]|nr:sigma-70 family RNA polymerase sigma factor [Candidatus Doudnabacteria bacterium]
METYNVLKYEGSERNQENLINLLSLIKKGEDGAFGKLYELYFTKIYRFVYYRVGHKETAEDITEEVFIKVYSKITSLDQPGAFEGWLYQIARNLVIDHYRKQKLTVALEDVENTLEYESGIIDVLILEQDQKNILKLLKQLSSDEQAVLKMKFFEDLENSTIAKLLSKSEGAVRVIQHRAIAKLQKLAPNQQ